MPPIGRARRVPRPRPASSLLRRRKSCARCWPKAMIFGRRRSKGEILVPRDNGGPSHLDEFWSLSALLDGYVIAAGGAHVELTRTADLLLRILDHLLPLGNPPDRARYGEKHREHGGGEAECPERD